MTGDKRARCRISSEYALPMPLIKRGSVSARFSVWLRRFSTASNSAARYAIELDSAGLVLPRARAAAHDVQRRALLRAGLREHQSAGVEAESERRLAA